MPTTKTSKKTTKKPVQKTKKSPKSRKQPKYLHHKPTDTARVWVRGKIHSLGKYESPESWDKYYRLLADLNKFGDVPPPTVSKTEITVAELAIHFTEYAQVYFKKVPQTVEHCKKAMKLLVEYYEQEPVNNFSPRSLQYLRDKLLKAKYVRKGIEKPYARQSINRWIDIIKDAFKFGVQQGWVTGNTFHALQCVDDLKQGHTDSMRMHFIELRAKRKTLNKKGKPQPSQVNRRKRNPKKQPGEQYSIASYARAVNTACNKAIKAGAITEADRWHPNPTWFVESFSNNGKWTVTTLDDVVGIYGQVFLREAICDAQSGDTMKAQMLPAHH